MRIDGVDHGDARVVVCYDFCTRFRYPMAGSVARTIAPNPFYGHLRDRTPSTMWCKGFCMNHTERYEKSRSRVTSSIRCLCSLERHP